MCSHFHIIYSWFKYTFCVIIDVIFSKVLQKSNYLSLSKLTLQSYSKSHQKPKIWFQVSVQISFHLHLSKHHFFPLPNSSLCNNVCVSHSVLSDSLQTHGLQPTRLLYPRNSLGKNTGVGCHSLLQGIFPTQGSIPGLLHCRQILYRLNHQGSLCNNNV